jgi:hypothetical protein
MRERIKLFWIEGPETKFGITNPSQTEEAINQWLESMGNRITITRTHQTAIGGHSYGVYVQLTIFYTVD